MTTAPPSYNPIALASAAAAFLAGILTAFTISVGGEMPVGEIVLAAVFCWILLYGIVTGSLPPEVPRTRLFGVFLICQAVAFAAYVFSDLYRGSSPHDMGRGWARMAFLAVDIVSVAYLFGCSRVNLLVFLFGELAGDLLHSLMFGALFDDMWKFGVGVPITYLAFFVASLFGRAVFITTAFAMSVVHLLLDYRSFAIACFLAGTATLITLFPRRVRTWLIFPAVIIAASAIGVYAVKHRDDIKRSTRSNVERKAMIIAAARGFYSSPLIGQGSWFSNSDVMTNFMLIRAEEAKDAEVGGFSDVKDGVKEVAIHSQILVALAEGGIFGATFFIAFGVALVAAMFQLTFTSESSRFTGIYIFILFAALLNWMFSPFSGAHRVVIAMACGLLFLLQRTRTPRKVPT
jgi:hypothetical protein